MTDIARRALAIARLFPRTRVPSSTLATAAAFVFFAGRAPAQGLDWILNPTNGRWYSETTTRLPWTAADDYARSVGAGLVTVRSAGESAFLQSNFFAAASPLDFHWLGLFQDPNDPAFAEPSGGWKWVSGEPVTYTNWAAAQPDNAGPIAENFARVLGPSGGANAAQWADSSDATGDGIGGSGDDWFIAAGEFVVFNTASSNVSVGALFIQVSDPAFPNNPNSEPVPSFFQTAVRTVVGGTMSVRRLYIEEGGVLKIEGPNPFTLLASEDVWIRGQVIANGVSSAGVNTLNTTNIPELGAAGQAGGGRGGTGSPLTNQSSPTGGAGQGAFGLANGGGQGGETGWSDSGNVNLRRGAGGGGGRLGDDVVYSGAQFDQRRIGLDAERGFDNLLGQNGALNGPGAPRGGAIGSSPFVDGDPSNDFFGLARDDASGRYILGELDRPWAGAGGGGGGDASQVPIGQGWPAPFSPGGDEKGAGGGGGGGSVHLLALRSIYFGDMGQISARGGTGGGGENTLFLNRVGGASGGGSGGHVVLESGERIDLRAKPPVVIASPAQNHWAIDVRGGQGGAGANDLGGSYLTLNGATETTPNLDACPGPGLYPTSGVNACRGPVDGAGGDGGPGLVQMHTPTGRVGTSPLSADILLPGGGSTLDMLCAPAPLLAQGSNGANPAHFISAAGGALGLFEIDSIDCDGDLVPDRYEIALDAGLDLNGNGFLDSCESPTYCTSSTSTSGCIATIAGVGAPSVSASSGFELVANDVDAQRQGRFFYGFAAQALPWAPNSTSYMCVASPLQRLPVMNSGGAPNSCDGELSIDWNDWRATNSSGSFNVGAVLYAQAWFRDPLAPRGTNLSDAVTFTLQP